MITFALIVCTFLAFTDGLRAVCYYSNQGQYRAGIAMFKPENIDPLLCTHLVYSYARIFGTHIESTEWNDDSNGKEEGMYSKFVNLKQQNKDLKVLLAIGDLTEKAESFIVAALTFDSRQTFAKNVVAYVRERNFDGVTMEWGSLLAKPNPTYNKDKFLLLLRAMRAEFQFESTRSGSDALILAVTLPGKMNEIHNRYHVPEIVQEADFVSIRSFDFCTAADKKVGLSSAFLSHPTAQGDDKYLSFTWVANYLLNMGIPREKINMGISTFGRTFLLKDPKQNRLGQEAVDYGNVGRWSAIIGMIGRYELCQSIWTGGSVVNVPSQGGRYHVKGNEWISYEDPLSVAQKTCFLTQMGFGGVTFWTLDLDDFSGRGCREGKYPLISTGLRVMKKATEDICEQINSMGYLKALSYNRTRNTKNDPTNEKKRVVCYIQSWGYHRRDKGLFVPENVEPTICTHLVYAYVTIKDFNIRSFIMNEESEPWREGLFQRLVNNKEVNPDLKVMVAVGGGAADKYIEMFPANMDAMNTFALNAVKFLRDRGFDGLELTWERPTVTHKQKFIDALQAVRKAFLEEAEKNGTVQLILTVSMPAGKAKIDVYGKDLLVIEQLVDFMSVKTFDFHGSWEPYTGLNSPLYDTNYESAENRQLNLDWVGKYYFSLGVSKGSINLGIPTYGRSYTLQDTKNNAVYAQTTGPGRAGEYTGTPGLLAYYEICDLLTLGAEVADVPEQRVPYAQVEDQWISFENVESIIEKACYITQLRFGGVNIWSLDLDDFMGLSCEQGKFPLVATVYNIVQYIDTSKCSNFMLLRATGGAGERSLPSRQFKYIPLVLVLVLVAYSTSN